MAMKKKAATKAKQVVSKVKAKAQSAKAKGKAAVKKPARTKVSPIPKGYHTATPSLTVRGAASALEFYKKAFGAKVLSRMDGPDGKVMHAEIKIGDSIVMLGDEMIEMGAKSPATVGGTSSAIMLYVKDVDGAYAKAVAAGATPTMPVADQFWGDRYGRLLDPYGHDWALASRKEKLTLKQMQKRMAAAFAPQA